MWADLVGASGKMMNTISQKTQTSTQYVNGKIVKTVTTITTKNGVTKEETVTTVEDAGSGGGAPLKPIGNTDDRRPTVKPGSKNDSFMKKMNEMKVGNEASKKPLDLPEIHNKTLKEINDYRKLHKADPLKLDDKLNKLAQEWAEHLVKTNSFKHRQNNQYGENLAMGSGSSADRLVSLWYNEIEGYNFKNPGFSSGTGHFTQLIWKGSQRLGVGACLSPDGATYLVTNYDPPGNVMGQFEENVLEKK